jgi:MFS family permease
METNWAAENLKTIRTLMERSALYRRALAPILILVGGIGVVAAIAGFMLGKSSLRSFYHHWWLVALIVIICALSLVRRQAYKNGEKILSAPTKRIIQAIFPPLLIGWLFGLLLSDWLNDVADMGSIWRSSIALIMVWTLFYGLAIHSASSFLPRSVRFFGWGFILIGIGMMVSFFCGFMPRNGISPYWMMGIIFGLSHLAYGLYLHFTEKRKNEA